MNHPSPRTSELIRGLYSRQELWRESTSLKDWPLWAFDEISASGEVSAIPPLAAFLLNPIPKVQEIAAATIAKLFANVTTSEFIQLDATCRHLWSSNFLAPVDWWDLKPVGLEKFQQLQCGTYVIGLASFHGNGFVRGEAVTKLAAVFDGSELPFLLLRVNDWVPSIRESALMAVLRRIRSDYAFHFFRFLPLVHRLEHCSRNRHDYIVSAVRQLLQLPGSVALLREGVLSKDPWLRRECFQLAISVKSVELAELFKQLLVHTDPSLRFKAVRYAFIHFSEAELSHLLPLLLRDRFMPIRCEALNALVYRRLADPSQAIFQALLDRHSSVRALARHWMQNQQPEFDFAAHYRKSLETETGSGQRPAILGLGETGNSADAPAILPFLRSPLVNLRKAAIRSIAILDFTHYRDELIAALIDPIRSVSNAATRSLLNGPSIHTARFLSLFRTESRPHVKLNLFILLMKQPCWARGVFLFQASRDQDDHVRALALRALREWLNRTRSMAVAPFQNELELLREELKLSAGILDLNQVREFEFCLKSY